MGSLKIRYEECPHGIPPGGECDDCWHDAWLEEITEQWREERRERADEEE